MAKILYLEDERWQVQGTVITFIEKELGHDVNLVTTVAEAQEALSIITYDIVFLDIMMDPTQGSIEFENSGLLIAQSILEDKFAEAGNPSSLPIVIASGVWDATVNNTTHKGLVVTDYAQRLEIPEEHFLHKPFTADEVQTILVLALQQDEEKET